MPIKRSSQFNPLPATSEIKEKCYFCIRMVSRKTNAGRPQPPSAHWYLFCKFCFTLCWCDRVTAFINRFCRLQRKKMIRMFYKPEKYFPIIACLLRKAISMLKSNSLHYRKKNLLLLRNATKNLLLYMIIKLILLHLPDGKGISKCVHVRYCSINLN